MSDTQKQFVEVFVVEYLKVHEFERLPVLYAVLRNALKAAGRSNSSFGFFNDTVMTMVNGGVLYRSGDTLTVTGAGKSAFEKVVQGE
jgi:hypothetical protein